MKEFNINNLVTYICIGLAGLVFITKYYPQNQTAVAEGQSKAIIKNAPEINTDEEVDDSAISILQQNRPLRMSISVDNPSFLKVRVGQEIKKGDVISDNSTERDRLNKQKTSVKLQIDNLKGKAIPKPFEPRVTVGVKRLPPAIFSEEEAAIAQSQMKKTQSQSMLEARTQLLQTDNPERRAEAENAEAGLQIASQKVAEQEQMIGSMRDMKLSSEILQHEEAELKKVRSEMDQANSGLDQAKAKLNASAILQQQELQQLQINVQLAESELQVAESRYTAAQNRRRLLEYDASLDEARREQERNQTLQEHSRQEQQYAQSVRDRDYQLAQLNISLSNIDDRLAQIPLLRSPRNGYIRRIKPWVGRNGKYETTITISAAAISSKNGGSVGVGEASRREAGRRHRSTNNTTSPNPSTRTTR